MGNNCMNCRWSRVNDADPAMLECHVPWPSGVVSRVTPQKWCHLHQPASDTVSAEVARLAAERDAARAEVEAMRPVVEAAAIVPRVTASRTMSEALMAKEVRVRRAIPAYEAKR